MIVTHIDCMASRTSPNQMAGIASNACNEADNR